MPIKLKIKGCDYDRFYNETSDEDYENYDDSDKFTDISEGKGLKILTPNKLYKILQARLPILAQIKAGNNSNKLKN